MDTLALCLVLWPSCNRGAGGRAAAPPAAATPSGHPHQGRCPAGLRPHCHHHWPGARPSDQFGQSNFDAQRDEAHQFATNVILLDHLLEQYGPESKPARDDLRAAVADAVDRIWNVRIVKTKPVAHFTATPAGQAGERAIRALAPTNEPQRLYQRQAI